MSPPRILSAKVLALVTAGAGAAAIATTQIGDREGRSLTAYRDIAGVWTICDGYTRGVVAGQTATPAQCDRLRESEIAKTLAEVDRLVTVPMSPARHAALASLAYNIGLGNFRQSTLLRRVNAGESGACDDILRWVWVGRMDCRIPSNNCRGIVDRRQEEAALCRM